MAKWKYVGYREERLNHVNEYNVKLSIPEIILVDDFNKQQSPSQVLQQIVNHPKGYLTPEEEKIAMSVVQWFGTNVGRGFHQAAMMKADHQNETLTTLQRTLKHKQIGKIMTSTKDADYDFSHLNLQNNEEIN